MTHPSDRGDAVLDPVTVDALAARDGDAAATARFVRATQAEVWRMVAHLVSRDVADDLTQETYLRALSALPRFAGRASARTWLLAIARRTCADHLRTVVRERRSRGELERAPRQRLHVPDVGEWVVLRAVLAGLPEERREAFVLTQVLALSYAEAAVVCGCPVGTIRSRVARARDELVRALAEVDPPAERSSGA